MVTESYNEDRKDVNKSNGNKYNIRLLSLRNKEEALSEFGKIGAEPAGCHIMADKFFNFAIKVEGVDFVGANILKQEMLSKGGDVVTSRETLCGYKHGYKENEEDWNKKKDNYKTSVIIFGTKKSIKSLIEKIKIQPFGLKSLSSELKDFLKRLERIEKGKILKIKDKEFDLEKETLIMGILNVTPDSFYDGGYYFEKDKAFRRSEEIIKEGAHIIDVGGMSTRPGSLPVSVDEEIDRVIPVIEYIAKNYDIPISIDTYRSEVAKRAVERGASIINDISGLTFDEDMAKIAADTGSTLVVMHIKGTPRDMQENPQYGDVVDEVYRYLYSRANKALEAGVDEGKIIVDPGIGFGKTLEHNLIILNKLSEFKSLGYPLLVGVSRKSFIGKILNLHPEERLEGSLASAICSVVNGADILRVHDVRETIRAVKVARSILRREVVS